MSAPPATTDTVSLSDAEQRLAQVVDRVSRTRDRVIVERDGTPAAAIISIADFERLQQFEVKREEDFAVFDEMAAAFADVDLDEIERETAKAVAEVRAEMRAEREADAAR